MYSKSGKRFCSFETAKMRPAYSCEAFFVDVRAFACYHVAKSRVSISSSGASTHTL